ncbi:MAG: DUF1722 domain-containing protein [candidate division Zixibacteria bacterium]|nr:DUF1722 domain-containing protein [candidate division Zixibacteria bacterium]
MTARIDKQTGSATADSTLFLGVSSCLLGKRVRFDGGHKHDRYLTEVLGKVFTFVSVCPEVETGMGVPRETIDLHGTVDTPRLVGNETGVDRTSKMNRYAARRVQQRDLARTCGFILKSKSPTCGLEKVRLYGSSGRVSYRATGLFAMALMRRYPSLPLTEAQQLHDVDTRDNFITRVFAYGQLRQLWRGRISFARLVEFHERERYLLMTHNSKRCQTLDELLLTADKRRPAIARDQYATMFMQALKRVCSS